MEGIKYVNLIEIGPVVIEIRGAENGELAVPVNNTLVNGWLKVTFVKRCEEEEKR